MHNEEFFVSLIFVELIFFSFFFFPFLGVHLASGHIVTIIPRSPPFPSCFDALIILSPEGVIKRFTINLP